MDFEEELLHMDKKVFSNAENTLKKINIALHLNAKKLKQKDVPPRLKKLKEWKEALEYWQIVYGEETNDLERVAERVGAFYEICTTLG